MKVRIGVTVGMGSARLPYETFGSVCRELEDEGYSTIWVSDEQSLRREMYVSATVVALNTSTIGINVGPTNPFTRHPAVTAASVSTLDEVSNGRMALTVSRGFSNVGNVGLKPALLAESREYITTIKALWRDKITTWRGKTIRLTYPTRPAPPVYLIAEGPKTLRMAGEIADGVICGMGQNPEVIKATLQHIREGAESAGRRLEDIDVCMHVRWHIADSWEQAVSEMKPMLASAAGHALAASFDGKLVPEEFQAQLRRIQKAYAYEEHREGGNNPATPLIDEVPGLAEYLAQRFTVAGTVKQVIQQIEEMANLGVRYFRFAGGPTDPAKEMKILAKEVLPHFR